MPVVACPLHFSTAEYTASITLVILNVEARGKTYALRLYDPDDFLLMMISGCQYDVETVDYRLAQLIAL
jgi:hypothetical protein